MNDRVKDQFNELSLEYDARRRLLIPCFDEFYNSGINLLSYEDGAPRVLDVGAGTGIYSETLQKRYPMAKFTLIDFAENMLELAAKKFANASFLLDDYYTHDYGDQKFDIIISALSMHHLDEIDKQLFYVKLYSLLDNSGELLNADIISSGSAEIDTIYDEQWTGFVKANIGEGEYFDRFLKSKDVDKPSPLSLQIEWLKKAGFAGVDCVYKRFNFAVFYARK